MSSVIEILKNAAMEMRQMHDFLAKLPTWECEGDCPTLMLKQAKPEDEQKWINQCREYQALITLLEK